MEKREIAGVEIIFSTEGADGEHLPSTIGMEIGESLVAFYHEHKPRRFLDIGSGAGHLSIIAGKLGAMEVMALDLNEDALSLTTKNWLLNGLDKSKLMVIKNNLLEGIDTKFNNRFDLITCNPPQLPTVIEGHSDRNNTFFYAGYDGRAVLDPLIRDSRQYLNEGGTFLLTGRSHNDWLKTTQLLDEAYGSENWKILRQIDVPFTIIENDILEYMLSKQQEEEYLRIFQKPGDKAWYHQLFIISATRV